MFLLFEMGLVLNVSCLVNNIHVDERSLNHIWETRGQRKTREQEEWKKASCICSDCSAAGSSDHHYRRYFAVLYSRNRSKRK